MECPTELDRKYDLLIVTGAAEIKAVLMLQRKSYRRPCQLVLCVNTFRKYSTASDSVTTSESFTFAVAALAIERETLHPHADG